MKLRKFKSFKQQDLLHHGLKNLDQFLPCLFPNDLVIRANIKKLKQKKETHRQNEYILDELPFRLHDTAWMTGYVTSFCQKYGLQIAEQDIQKYVQNSKKFKQACEDYGGRYIKLKLESMLTMGRAKHETIVEAGFPDFAHRIDCDEYFRQHALSYFIIKGFPRAQVEAVLESNTHVWQRTVMYQAFENICNLDILMTSFPQSESAKQKFYRKKQHYRKLWVRNRVFEYFHRYQKVLKALGLKIPKITEKEAIALKEQIEAARQDMLRVMECENTTSNNLVQ